MSSTSAIAVWVGAVELAPRDGTIGARGTEAFHRAYDAGLLIRVTADTIALSPPLIVSEAQVHEIADVIRKVLHEVA